MQDPFVGHHAPNIVVYVRGKAGVTVPYARAWTFVQATEFIRDAQADGYTSGEVRAADGRLLWTWPEDPIEPPEVGRPPDDEPGGYAPTRRRR